MPYQALALASEMLASHWAPYNKDRLPHSLLHVRAVALNPEHHRPSKPNTLGALSDSGSASSHSQRLSEPGVICWQPWWQARPRSPQSMNIFQWAGHVGVAHGPEIPSKQLASSHSLFLHVLPGTVWPDLVSTPRSLILLSLKEAIPCAQPFLALTSEPKAG